MKGDLIMENVLCLSWCVVGANQIVTGLMRLWLPSLVCHTNKFKI